MMIVRELWREAGRFPGLLVGSISLLTLVLATHVGQAVAIAWALTAAVSGDGSAVLGALGAVAGMAVARMALMLAQDAAASRLGGLVRRALRGGAMRSALTASRLHDQSARDGSLRVVLADGIDGTDTYVSKYVPAVVQVFVVSPGIVLVLLFVDPWAAAWVAFATVLALLGPLVWKRVMARRSLEHWDSYEALSADILDALRGMAMLRALGDVPETRARVHARSEGLRRATERVMRVSLAETGVIDLAIQAGIVAAVTTTIVQAATGQRPAFELYLVLLLASEAFRPIRDLSRHWHAGFLGLTAVPGLRDLGAFDEAARVADTRGGRLSRPSASGSLRADPSTRAARTLHVRDLSYRYPAAATDVLDGLELTARRGRITAIVGSSGVGKSTLFDVLLGFLSPRSGSAELDGEPLTGDDIAVLSQRPVLFAGSIRDNLAVAGDATVAELTEVCRAAGILDEILALPDGFDSPVAEAGMSLSGGQRQRLALARALLADRPVLLVDEPTSALDSGRAGAVMETLRRVASERIVVMITHRPETLTSDDERFRLERGRLERSLA